MSNAWLYAVWPHPRSRSRSRDLESLKIGHFQHISPPTFPVRGGKWLSIVKLEDNMHFVWAGFLVFGLVFMSRDFEVCWSCKLAKPLRTSRSSVPHRANFYCTVGLHDVYNCHTGKKATKRWGNVGEFFYVAWRGVVTRETSSYYNWLDPFAFEFQA